MDLRDFIAELQAAPSRIERLDCRDALLPAADQFGQEIDGNFRREQDSNGADWLPHSPVTIALHGEHPLLRLSYAMYSAAVDYRNPASYHELSSQAITIGIDGNDIPYANRQDQGGGNVPQREYFYLNEDSQEIVRQVIDEALFPLIERRVFRGAA